MNWLENFKSSFKSKFT